MQQFEIELNRCAAMIKAADEAFSKHDYVASESLYHACLASLDEIYAGDSVTIADCLTGLGDSYYFQDKFGSALPMYQRLLVMRERLTESTPASLIKSHFKLAKTHEKLKNDAEAADHYKRAREISQQKLVTGHPLGTTLLESYAKYLHRVEPDSLAYKEVEEKARKNREVYLDPVRLNIKILEGLAEVRDGQLVLAEEIAKLEKARQKEMSGKMGLVLSALGWLKSRPRIALALLTLPLTLSLITLIGVASYYILGGEKVQPQLVQPGQTFHTDDGHLDVFVLPEHQLKVRREQNFASKSFNTVSNAWRALYMVYMHPQYGMFWLEKHGNTLVDQNGMSASLGEAGPDPLYATMLDVAAELHSEPLRKQADLELPLDIQFKNPYTEQIDHVEMHNVACRNDLKNASSVFGEELNQCERKSDLSTLRSITGIRGPFTDSPVVCLRINDVRKAYSYCLIGFNRNGAPLRTCVGNTVLRLESTNGVPFKSNCKFSEVSPSSAATFANPNGTVVVSSTTPQRVRALCFAVVVDFGLMPFVILLGVLLREQISKWFDQKHLSRSEQGAHMLALVYIWFTPFYLLYTFAVFCWMIVGFI
ncbi:MAG: tetratricopeptide repeat protein [Candidatus Melainabacteria bacterium]|nr:MAG: tetratricopeptide repeat protein [Candidatus Melainabacteria bacterium]